MSEEAAQRAASKGAAGTQEAPRQRPDPGPGPGKDKKRSPVRGIVITIVGALVTAGLAAAVMKPSLVGIGPSSGEDSILDVMAPADINAALPSLDPVSGKAAADDAKACKVPLAWVSLVQAPGSKGGIVRVRSGSYLSPPVQLGAAPQRIAIPWPTPYPSGRGVLSVIGDVDQVGFYLRPGGVWTVKGAVSINVWWTPKTACP